MYDFVISINVHEHPAFLNAQIENIKKNVKYKYIIILSCNNLMYNESITSENVIKNPEIIKKKRFHGSLTQGICSNMMYALDNFVFKWFIILSSKNIFYKPLDTGMLEKEFTLITHYNHNNLEFPRIADLNYQTWHWTSFKTTLLAEYYINNNKLLYGSEHEGLTFEYSACQNIIQFLNNNENIKNDLFNFDHAIEEFALQTICMNSNNKPFISLGNGCNDFYIDHDKNHKCVYKVHRDLICIKNTPESIPESIP